MTRLLTLTLTLFTGIALAAWQGQDHHTQMTARGAAAMGFDQAATTHHFYLYEDGGAIQVTVNDVADVANLTAIQTHLPHIAQMFAAGDFSTPHFIHESDVPGTAAMTKLRGRINYVFQKMKNGGRVKISTSYLGARAAIHDFLRYQIVDHKTGDSLEITSLHE